VRTRSSKSFALPWTALLAAALIGSAAGAAWAQESDFFEEGSSYFQSETIEGASKHAEAPTETPATVTILGREDIERYGFRTLADVMNFASLGDFTINDGRYDFAGGRGLFSFEDFNTRILIMLDGHPLNEPWNNFVGVGREMLVPLDLVERIEITYGPSSMLYGGYSLYGLINVVTRTGADLSGGRLRLSGGSWSTKEAVGSFGLSGSTPSADGATERKWDVLLAGGYYGTKGYDYDLASIADERNHIDGGKDWGGRQRGTDFERSPFGFLYAKNGELSVFARSGYRKHGEPFAPYGSDYGSRQDFIRDDKSFLELRWDHPLTAHLGLSVRLFHDIYSYHEKERYTDDETYPGYAGYDYVLNAHDKDSGGEVRLTWQTGTHLLTIGGEYRRRYIVQEVFTEFYDDTIAPDSHNIARVRGHLAVGYIQEEWRPIDEFTLVAGGNWADTKPGGTKALPRFAMIYKPSSTLSIKGLYGKGFRPPSVYEAAYADYLIQIPNPSLQSEEISSSELSILWNPTPRLSLQAYGFHSKLKGLIQGVTIESADDVEGGVLPPSGDPNDLVGMLQFQPAGDVASDGAGAAARFRSGRFRLYGNVTYSKAKLESKDGTELDLPASSHWLASGGASCDIGDLTTSITLRYVGKQNLHPDRAPGQAGGFLEANLHLLWKTIVVFPVNLTLDVWNLAGEKGDYAASSIYTPAATQIEGRRVTLGAEARF